MEEHLQSWNATTGQIIYRSSRSWHTKCNFQIFTASDFLAAAMEHIPLKSQQTIRYYGLYSNKRRGMDGRKGSFAPSRPLHRDIRKEWSHPRRRKAPGPCARSGVN